MRRLPYLILSCWLLACRQEKSELAADADSTAKTASSQAPISKQVTTGPAPRESRTALVGLNGLGSQPPALSEPHTGTRIYARALRVTVYSEPNTSATKLGYLRAGASSLTHTEDVKKGNGCAGGWYPVEPVGFVCLDAKATLDPNDPIVQATSKTPPDRFRKLPYIYGTVRKPGPFYARVPKREELAETEPGFEERLEAWLALKGEDGASYGQALWHPGETVVDPKVAWEKRLSDALPVFLNDHRGTPNIRNEPRYRDALSLGVMPSRLGHGILQTFLSEGRRYALTTDLVIVPTDRLRPIRGSEFHGVVLGTDIDFPFGFVRSIKARFYVFTKASGLTAGADAPYRAAIKLSGKQQFFSGRLYYETLEGQWLSDQDFSRVEIAKRMPGWATRGEKWIDVNVTKQLLVLYQGTNPVYATLISSGEAGLDDPTNTTATPRGIFRIHTKHISATMSSDEVGEEFELRDVPYVQYFEKGYALHGAYWHDRFGMPKSHGCINLSPEDARRIFHWTEPGVPLGWHGTQSANTGTVIFVHP